MFTLQFIPWGWIQTWAAAEVTTMWAAWATAGLTLTVHTLLLLALALPSYFLLERPCTSLWPRSW